MNFVTVRDFRGKSARIWGRLSREKEIVITLNGRPVALLSAVPGGDIEKVLADLRRARALRAIESLQQTSVRRDCHLIKDEDIDAEIRAVRRRRRR